ncbi:hypothetical protein D3C78_1052530 [compost metagenome]
MHTAAASRNAFDLLNNVHTFNHFCKYAITPTLQILAGEVQEVVVCYVDEELCSCRVRSLSTGHCQRTAGVFQTVIRFVFDRFFGVFLDHARFETAALDHKTVNHTVENRVVVEAFATVVQEVFNCFRRFIIKCFDDDIAMISVESNHFFILFRYSGASTHIRVTYRGLL